MDEQERAALVQQIREEIAAEYRERERVRKAAWRAKNREHVNAYAREYQRQRREAMKSSV